MQASGASTRRRFPPLGGSLKLMAVLAIAVGFGLTMERTEAARAGHSVMAKPTNKPVTAVAATDVVSTSSIKAEAGSARDVFEAPDDAPCDISRKRLFVEGRGWIVRRVATCY